MKSCHRLKNPAIAAIGAWWLSNVVVPVRAFQYGRAARRDERDGCPEGRKMNTWLILLAGLVTGGCLGLMLAALCCSAKCADCNAERIAAGLLDERLMRLPRQLAEFIIVSPATPELRWRAGRILQRCKRPKTPKLS